MARTESAFREAQHADHGSGLGWAVRDPGHGRSQPAPLLRQREQLMFNLVSPIMVRAIEGMSLHVEPGTVHDPAAGRRSIGLAGQFAAVDDVLIGAENRTLVGLLTHLSKAWARTYAIELLGGSAWTKRATGRPGLLRR